MTTPCCQPFQGSLVSLPDMIHPFLIFFSFPNGVSWNLTFSRDLLDFEVDSDAILLDSLNNVKISHSLPNRCRWSLESFVIFSSKSFYTSLILDSSLSLSFLDTKVWKGPSPPLWYRTLSSYSSIKTVIHKKKIKKIKKCWSTCCILKTLFILKIDYAKIYPIQWL